MLYEVITIEVTVVNKDVDYKELLTKEILIKTDVDSVKKLCEPNERNPNVRSNPNQMVTPKTIVENGISKNIVRCDKLQRRIRS